MANWTKNSSGQWEVTPSTTQTITLNTAGKYMNADIKIKGYTAPSASVSGDTLVLTNGGAIS